MEKELDFTRVRFTHNRRRFYGPESPVIGDVLDQYYGRHVRYETDGETFDRNRKATVNWSACGAVPVDEARRYAKQILMACDAAEVAPRAFEPEDTVRYPSLEKGRVALVKLVLSEDEIIVDEFVPGAFEETNKERPLLVRTDGVKRIDP